MLDPRAVEVAAIRNGRVVDLVYLRRQKARLGSSPRDCIIGHTKHCRWHLSEGDLPPWLDEMPIVRPRSEGEQNGYEVIWLPSFGGHGRLHDQDFELADLPGASPCSDIEGAFTWPLPTSGSVVLATNRYQFVITEASLPQQQKPMPLANLHPRKQAYTIGAAIVHALLLLLMITIPPDPKSLAFDAFGEVDRLLRFQVKPHDQALLSGRHSPNAGAAGFVDSVHAGYKDRSGKMGDPTLPKHRRGRATIKGPPENRDIQVARALAVQAALREGLPGSSMRQEGSHIASIFGRDSALGSDADNLLGTLSTESPGPGFGMGGLGPTGNGRGGGGDGDGFIPSKDGLPRIGPAGNGDRFVFGRGPRAHLRAHTATAPDAQLGHAEVHGSLDKDIVRRVVRKHIAEVRFCYENEALKHPSLSGRVVIHFTISGSGRVSSSQVGESSTRNATLDGCIAAAARRWQFPQPHGGGIVVVSYPFVLELAGR